MTNTFSKKLLQWYKLYGRHDLPWQHNQTHYRVWISEIMLQQTQVTTVIPYYERFMRDFPTVFDLANAREDDVLAHWSGLGYYARARNIHKTAKIIANDFAGNFPTTVEAMAELPGIGLSTAGAIISFAQQEKAVILDGNVKRVLSRYFAIDQLKEDLWPRAFELTPQKNAHHYNQAIMDLGATLCTRTKPRCADCPVKNECIAFQKNKVAFYPVKKAKKTRPVKKIEMLIIQNKQKEILLVKRESKGIWGGLWSFPEQHPIEKIGLKKLKILAPITHQFTHFTLIITPVIYSIDKKISVENGCWHALNQKLPGGIAAPVVKILQQIK